MEVRPANQRLVIKGNTKEDLQVVMEPDYSDHVLVSGERYKESYISMWLGNSPGWYGSGLMVGVIGKSLFYKRPQFSGYQFPKIYEIKGRFGFVTENNFDNGKIRAKATYKHIKKPQFENILSKIEGAQRKKMFELSGVGLESEEAYKIAQMEWIPPAPNQKQPLIYGIRLISFNLPDFAIEVQCTNVDEKFLGEFVSEIGLAMKSMAFCTGLRLTKFGPFSTENSLIDKLWNVENLIENIYLSNQIMDNYVKEHPQELKKRPENYEKQQ